MGLIRHVIELHGRQELDPPLLSLDINMESSQSSGLPKAERMDTFVGRKSSEARAKGTLDFAEAKYSYC